MKKVSFLLLFALGFLTSIAQETCGVDILIANTLNDSVLKANFDSVQVYIRRQVSYNRNRLASGNTTQSVVQPDNYIIPVVFHLVGY